MTGIRRTWSGGETRPEDGEDAILTLVVDAAAGDALFPGCELVTRMDGDDGDDGLMEWVLDEG